jgi:hypothetical protein
MVANYKLSEADQKRIYMHKQRQGKADFWEDDYYEKKPNHWLSNSEESFEIDTLSYDKFLRILKKMTSKEAV